METDAAFGPFSFFKHALDGRKNDLKLGVVSLLHILNFSAQFLVGGQHFAQAHERSHDGNVDLYGPRAAQNAQIASLMRGQVSDSR